MKWTLWTVVLLGAFLACGEGGAQAPYPPRSAEPPLAPPGVVVPGMVLPQPPVRPVAPVAPAPTAPAQRTALRSEISTVTIQSGALAVRLPLDPPSEQEVLKACKEREKLGKQVRITCELVEYRLHPARFYPLVGLARLSHCKFHCVVRGEAADEEVVIERDVLILAKK